MKTFVYKGKRRQMDEGPVDGRALTSKVRQVPQPKLTPREATVWANLALTKRSLSEIGTRLGISRQRVGQIRDRLRTYGYKV